MTKTNVLVIGSGAREHALGAHLSRSPLVGDLHFSPGNVGMAHLGRIAQRDEFFTSLFDLVEKFSFSRHKIGLVVIGPEHYLAKGVADEIRKIGIAVLGPDKALARLEYSKIYACEIMDSLSIATPKFVACHSVEAVASVLHTFYDALPVVKQDGLAKGKGVYLFKQKDQLLDLVKRHFCECDESLLLQERVQGTEVSMLALCDGESYVLLPPAMDYKRASANEDAPMTGGMGCIAPLPGISSEQWENIGRRVVAPIMRWSKTRNPIGFRGCLFVGLMLTSQGPKVLEYNVRFGDPEIQTLLQLLPPQFDLMDLLSRCATGQLGTKFSSGDMLPRYGHALRHAVTVIVAAKGYPDSTEMVTFNWRDLPKLPEGITIYQANTISNEEGKILASDNVISRFRGRILSITATSKDSLEQARDNVYQYVKQLQIPNTYYREDIAAEIPKIVL